MSLDRELTIKERKVVFKKCKSYLKYFFDNFSIEHDHFYKRAKSKEILKSTENIYGPCVELMNYQLLKENGIHCIKNDEMFWNDITHSSHDGYSYGDFSIELDCEFYQVEVTTIYSPKDYRQTKKKVSEKLKNAMKYKDQGIIFVNMMNWMIPCDFFEPLKQFAWETEKTKYNFEKVEAIVFIKHDMNFKAKKIEIICNPNSKKDLTKLKELAMMYNIN